MANWIRTIPIRALFARMFTLLFFVLAFTLVSATAMEVFAQLQSGKELMQTLIKGVNGSIIALAVYELAMVIRSEYSGPSESHDVITMLRRTLPRFIGTVCVAMSLEGLIMIIKYSQLDLAGNLYYPVAIIVSTAMLLAALGVFLRMAPRELVRDSEEPGRSGPAVQPPTDPAMVKPGQPWPDQWQANEPGQGFQQGHA
ncbi:hypothetical protein [Marinobacter sp.]|jgi:hypothetical protein|uniref:hypothetical protein n=1 Tax=Marinobacter sp. TaxID=50741 RepID=UPI0035C738F8